MCVCTCWIASFFQTIYLPKPFWSLSPMHWHLICIWDLHVHLIHLLCPTPRQWWKSHCEVQDQCWRSLAGIFSQISFCTSENNVFQSLLKCHVKKASKPSLYFMISTGFPLLTRLLLHWKRRKQSVVQLWIAANMNLSRIYHLLIVR